jgi:hypothetical protein
MLNLWCQINSLWKHLENLDDSAQKFMKSVFFFKVLGLRDSPKKKCT